MLGLIDEVDLAVEGGGVAGGPIQQLADFGDVLRFQCVAPGAEQVQSLAVHKENCFLRFVDHQLRHAVKVLTGMLPDEGAVVPLVLDKFHNFTHKCLPLLLGFLNVYFYKTQQIGKLNMRKWLRFREFNSIMAT